MTLDHRTLEGRLVWLAFGLAAFYWVIETLADFLLFGRQNLLELFFPLDDPEELWMRFLFLILFVTFGLYARSAVMKLRRAENNMKQSFLKLEQGLEGTIQAMAMTVEIRDPYTAGHQQRVAGLACAIAQEMGLSEEKVTAIRLAAAVHDIGKISVPAEILSRPGRLGEVEFKLIQAHPTVAYDILSSIDFPWPIADIVLQHHEKLDGSGYPLGLKGEGILVEARILSVADVVEAMSSHRPYRPALGVEKAIEEITENKATLYDATCVDACLKVFAVRRFEFREGVGQSFPIDANLTSRT